MTDTAERDRKVTFKRKATVKSARGSMKDGPLEAIGSAWAAVNYGRGDERRRAGIDASEISATLRVLDSEFAKTLTTADFVKLDGVDWNISNVVPYRRSHRDITATRRG